MEFYTFPECDQINALNLRIMRSSYWQSLCRQHLSSNESLFFLLRGMVQTNLDGQIVYFHSSMSDKWTEKTAMIGNVDKAGERKNIPILKRVNDNRGNLFQEKTIKG